MLTRRQAFCGLGATALTPLFARSASAALMKPATAEPHFRFEAEDTILRFSFVEFLWRENAGEVDCHLEIDTRQFIDANGTVNGRPGKFRKGGAKGLFYISFGPDLPASSREFWWPPDGVCEQPPLKGGQNRGGRISRLQGIARNSFTNGYQLISPAAQLVNGDMRLYFELSGFDKEIVRLSAEHFVNQGDVRIYCDFSYMTGQ